MSTDSISEKWNLRTNLLEDIVGSVNLGGELGIGTRNSIVLTGSWEPWAFKEGLKRKHWVADGEWRHWFGRTMHGHFMGIHGLGGEFNMQGGSFPFNIYPALKDYRFQGWMAGGGITYGYRWNFNKHLGMEGVIGLGYIYASYDKYVCGHCGERVSSGVKHYVGPTKLALNLIYRFGATEKVPLGEQDNYTSLPSVAVAENKVEQFTARPDTVYLPTTPNIHRADFSLRLQYPLDRSEIVPSLAHNAEQIDSLKSFIDRYVADPNISINTIMVEGYASVEGTWAHNRQLSEERAESVAELIKEFAPELTPLIHSYGLGEDWSDISFEGKDQIMEISDPDARERILRRLDGGRIWRLLMENVLPYTRHTNCVIYFTEFN